MNRPLLDEQLSQLPLYMYFFVKTEELTFSDRIRYICQHECPMYGKTWACPPAVGEVADCRARCMGYDSGLLISTITEVPDISDIQACLDTRQDHEEITRQAAELLSRQVGDVFILSSEACSQCPDCTYPNAPCRHPDKMHPCIESHGIVLTELAEKYGIEFQYGDHVVTWFSLLLYHEA